jgi:MYXO-CTERM domain-containing protein
MFSEWFRRQTPQRLAIALGLVFAAFLILPSQQAHSYTYMKGNPRWQFSSMPIKWYVTYSKAAHWNGRSLEQIQKLVEDALNVWEKVDCSFMMFRYMGTTTTGALKGDGKNVIEWVAQLPSGASPSAVGLGGPIWGRGGAISEGNVWLKSGQRSDKSQKLILTHEVGHAIGFGHTTTSNAIMAPAYNPRTYLTQDDKDCICNAYPVASNTCTSTSDCPSGLFCNGGRCGKCGKDTDCPTDHYCDQSACRPNCDKDSDCSPKGRLCKNRRCTSCKADKDCGSGRFCEKGLCYDKCEADSDCPPDATCRENGRCVKRGGCLKDGDCKKDEYCSKQVCVSQGSLGKVCDSPAACSDDQSCVPNLCEVDLDCAEGYKCVKENGEGTCKKDDKDQETGSVCSIECSKDKPCPGDKVCRKFDDKRSFCYPKTRVIPKDDKPKDGDGGGCECSTTAGPDFGNLGFPLLLMLLTFLLIQSGRRKQNLVPIRIRRNNRR